jgi:hypothetical protein
MSSLQPRFIALAILVLMNGRAIAQSPTGSDAESGDYPSGASNREGEGSPEAGDTADTDEEPKEEKDPMNWIGVGLKGGFLYYGDATFNGTVYEYGYPVVKNTGIPARAGFVLSLPVNLGGAGFGWAFDPYLGFGQVGSYGIYTGPTITLHLSDMTYLGFGFGVRFGAITVDFWGTRTDVGLDVYGRVPLVLTYYVADSMGLLVDVGFGFGGSGYRPYYTQQQLAPGVTAPQLQTQFGVTYQIDASAGVRFP